MLPPVEEMIRAYQSSDQSYDGLFFVAVRTTGIFCRPSCPARKPYPRNVEFFATPQEALNAGYRPCKRCHPMETNGQIPAWATQLLQQLDQQPAERLRDTDLRARGLDPVAVRRFFLKQYGMTFQAYARARRLGQAFAALRQGAELDDVALDAGYESFSGFREAFGRVFGQPPGKSRQGDYLTLTWLESPLGPLIAGATPDAICFLEFSDRRLLENQLMTLQKHFGCGLVPGQTALLEQLSAEIKEYFTGQRTNFTLPLAYPGTPFQEQVWRALQRIPYGETLTYQTLAHQLGLPHGQRAVGQANGLNRIAILIPCHRVVNTQGQLSGYGGGLWRKQWLLSLERSEQPVYMRQSELTQS